MIMLSRRMASPSSMAVAAAVLVLFLSAATLSPVASAQGQDERSPCVRKAAKQIKDYASCVYNELDEYERKDEKKRTKMCGLYQQIGRNSVRPDAVEVEADEKSRGKPSKGKTGAGVKGDKRGGRNATMNAMETDGHRIRRLQKGRTRGRTRGSKGAAAANARACLQNFDEDSVDSIVQVCLDWNYKLMSCKKLAFATTKIKDDEESMPEEGESGWRCQKTSSCNSGLFCAVECFNGIGCPKFEQTIGNGYCQPCDECKQDDYIFEAGGPQEDPLTCRVCPRGPMLDRIFENDETLSELSPLANMIQPDEMGKYWYSGEEEITFFAFERPNKDCEDIIENCINDPVKWQPQCYDFLRFHTLSGAFSASEVVDILNSQSGELMEPALNFEELALKRDKDNIEVNREKIKQVDKGEPNAMVHIISEALCPLSASNSLWDILTSRTEFSEIGKLIQDMGKDTQKKLRDILTDKERIFTMFAPNNDAIESFLGSLKLDSGNLDIGISSVLKSHIVEGANVLSGNLRMQFTALPTLLEGEKVAARKTPNDQVAVKRGEQVTFVTTPDIIAVNGIIHMIEDVLIPTSILAI
mmetsp:Transcript_1119/g.3055  ORF Transcript_1119/g.3055 Transcript_1119/m.3055 type:complete len:585 (-) Transcript_1119:202-1956(-)